MEDAASAAKARGQAAGEAVGGTAGELKASATQKADELSAALRKEKEGGMTATERASGRWAVVGKGSAWLCLL
jgi:hypothetical protein